MDSFEDTRRMLNRQLDEAVTADPLVALKAIGRVRQDIDTRLGHAVRAAIQDHSWTEIGAALGVSKQAAHHKFAKEWAEQLKNELKTAIKTGKTAAAEGAPAVAAEANAKRDAVIAELKNAHRRRKTR